ncbi:MAG: hypothetical protein Q7T68_05670 [Sphingopyxis sp.]|nr:hypothetical protein [Sphingopyxis sp.]
MTEAVEFVRRIYDGVHRSQIDSITALKLMGFSGKSGASAAALGSVRQYGLIEGIGDKTRVSELALGILEPASDTERLDSIREASKQPEVFRLLYDRFDGRIPTANEPLRAFLIRELGFSKNGADECIKSLRESMNQIGEPELANLPESASAPTNNGDAIFSDARKSAIIAETAPTPQLPAGSQKRLSIPLTRECSAELTLVGVVSEKALLNLIRHIDLMKEVWAED